MKQETIEAKKALIKKGNDEKAINAYIALGTGDEDLSDFEESYCGTFRSDEEFAQEQATNIGPVDFKNTQWPAYCIDWEYAARELMMDYSEQDGHYFRNI